MSSETSLLPIEIPRERPPPFPQMEALPSAAAVSHDEESDETHLEGEVIKGESLFHDRTSSYTEKDKSRREKNSYTLRNVSQENFESIGKYLLNIIILWAFRSSVESQKKSNNLTLEESRELFDKIYAKNKSRRIERLLKIASDLKKKYNEEYPENLETTYEFFVALGFTYITLSHVYDSNLKEVIVYLNKYDIIPFDESFMTAAKKISIFLTQYATAHPDDPDYPDFLAAVAQTHAAGVGDSRESEFERLFGDSDKLTTISGGTKKSRKKLRKKMKTSKNKRKSRNKRKRHVRRK